MNLLATSTGVLGYGINPIDTSSMLDWLGKIVQTIIEWEWVGFTAVGIIIFTLILKTIVLPLDIYSRIKTKKQALVMEKMRPQMEKLQKQYANDKQLYQQKVMELQKKSGYSMFGACLPMIVSLVIFIIVFQAFSAYSQYATVESYNEMVKDYNGVVNTYVYDETTQQGFLVSQGDDEDYKVYYEAFAVTYLKDNNNTTVTLANITDEQVSGAYSSLMEEYIKAYPSTSIETGSENSSNPDIMESVRLTLVSYYIDNKAAEEVATKYAERMDNGEGSNFLWVKNIWYPDSMFSHEVPDFNTFRQTATRVGFDANAENYYNKVTAGLGDQKNSANGYFILIVLSIGVMLLQQFISMRSNKATNELSSVDGSAQRTTKWMMILMPIMYGIFAFMYSSAFSIYMITNTTYSILTTLIINKAMNVWFSKHELKEEHKRMRKEK